MEGAIFMATTTNNKRHRILIFVFKTEEAGKAFKNFAYEHLHTSRAQFVVHDSNVDTKRVLVRGTGSLIYDSCMRADLLKEAEKLGGYLAKEIAS